MGLSNCNLRTYYVGGGVDKVRICADDIPNTAQIVCSGVDRIWCMA